MSAISKQRWNELMDDKDGTLTLHEMSVGYHWCGEFDGLLVGPDSDEWQFCKCHGEDKADFEKRFRETL